MYKKDDKFREFYNNLWKLTNFMLLLWFYFENEQFYARWEPCLAIKKNIMREHDTKWDSSRHVWKKL